MPTSRFQRIFLFTGILSLLVAYVGLWVRFINDPVERTGSDFIAFYSAGRVAQDRGNANVYDPELQQDIEEEEVGFPFVTGQVLLYNHLPFLIPILRILVNRDYVGSFYRWVFLLLIVYGLSLFLLSRLLKSTGTDAKTNALITISSFLFLPLFFSLMNGQDTAILLLGTVLWFYGLVTGNQWLSGLGLSLTTVRPQVSLTLAIPMLFSHRKVFLAYALGSGLLATLSLLIVSPNGLRDYIHILLISASGQWHGMKEEAMLNLIGLLTRIWGVSGKDFIHLAGWLAYGIAIIGLSLLWGKKKLSLENRVGLTVIVALFTSPHLHFHDLTLLLIPFYMLVRSGHLKTFAATAFPIATSLFLLVGNLTPYLQYTIPYVVMAALVWCLYPANIKKSLASPHQS